MTTLNRLAVLVALAGALVANAPAQDGESGLQALQSKTVLSEDELGQLRSWIEQRVAAVADSSAQAGSELRSAYAGSQGFREAYAKLAVEIIRPVYGRASLKLIAATQLVAVLGALDDMQVHATLIEALGDKRVAVRTAAAAGLGRLRTAIARSGAAAVTSTLNALQTAGVAETSTVALKTIYRAMDFQAIPTPADAGGNARTLLSLLRARQGKYASARSATPAWAAEIDGLRLAGVLLRGMNDTDRTQLAEATGQILLTAVMRYADELYEVEDGSSALDVAIRNDTEVLIQQCEAVLVQVLKPGTAPDVTAQMRELEPVNMKLEMKKWAGLLQAKTGKNFDPDAVAANP